MGLGISPWWTGQTSPAWAGTVQDDQGNAVNLNGATLALIVHNPATGVDVLGAGAFTITDATAGQFTYQWATSDSAVAAEFALVLKITIAGASAYSDPIPWVVNEITM